MAINTRNVELSARARERVYSDLDFAFRMNPATNDVAIKREEEAIKQSVMNILMTSRGERPFMPSFGSGLKSYLFENIDPATISLMEESIRSALLNYEPRVRVLFVDISDLGDQNAINIRLELEILFPISGRTTVEFTVERLR